MRTKYVFCGRAVIQKDSRERVLSVGFEVRNRMGQAIMIQKI